MTEIWIETLLYQMFAQTLLMYLDNLYLYCCFGNKQLKHLLFTLNIIIPHSIDSENNDQ